MGRNIDVYPSPFDLPIATDWTLWAIDRGTVYGALALAGASHGEEK